ncbi:MAG: 3-dehydroquinate synthase [Erysipelotrichales bacterium]|nr:3-dehydroquinate synthase [Erysipelotrichales bacterium]
MTQNIIIAKNLKESLKGILNNLKCDNPFVLCDENTVKYIDELGLDNKTIITINSGESNKNLETACKIWNQLDNLNVNRNSILINFGGGMISDIGGFCASVYKRGIRFINIPTTLLGAVDASIGGKNGIDFENNKNEIGTFNLPYCTIISKIFYKTLSKEELLSGYGEMIKHSILFDKEEFFKLLKYDITKYDDRLISFIKNSVKYKDKIVSEDFKENSKRKLLNFGHTIGHAIESYQLEISKPLYHGYCVVYGILLEMIISNLLYDFSMEIIDEFSKYIKKNYGSYIIDNPKEIISRLIKDKKNKDDSKINFTLIDKDFNPIIDNYLDKDILEMIEIFNQKMKK